MSTTFATAPSSRIASQPSEPRFSTTESPRKRSQGSNATTLPLPPYRRADRRGRRGSRADGCRRSRNQPTSPPSTRIAFLFLYFSQCTQYRGRGRGVTVEYACGEKDGCPAEYRAGGPRPV